MVWRGFEVIYVFAHFQAEKVSIYIEWVLKQFIHHLKLDWFVLLHACAKIFLFYFGYSAIELASYRVNWPTIKKCGNSVANAAEAHFTN